MDASQQLLRRHQNPMSHQQHQQQQQQQQQQYLNNTNQRNLINRSHYTNRQQLVGAPVVGTASSRPARAADTPAGQWSDPDERSGQLNSINSTASSSQKTTNSSEAAMLSSNKQLQMQREHQLMHQQHQQRQRQHQQQQQQQQLQQVAGANRQAALASHTLAAPGKSSSKASSQATTTAAVAAAAAAASVDQLTTTTTTSSSDHTIDDLQQLAGHGYSSNHRRHHHHHNHHGLGRPFHSHSHSHHHHHDRSSLSTGSASTSSGGRFLLGVLFTLAELLLFATVLLWLYWAYQHDDGLGWQSDRKQQFNTHAALMLFGFIFLTGQAMLIHRSFQCCSRIYTKILHTILFVLASSAISLGLILAYTAQENVGPNNKPIMHFYSLHAWCALTTVGLFVLQFVFGFVSFLVLLCCDQATANYRAALLPIHKTFGLIIFSLAIATCLTGLLQTARSRLSSKLNKTDYHELAESGIVINLIGVCLICLAILMPYIIRNLDIKRPFRSELDRHLNKLSQLDMRI